MRPHITENGRRPRSAHPGTLARTAALVIISWLAGVRPAPAAPAALTTAAVTMPLATVVVDGSSVYAAPRLFAAYSAWLGGPASREQARDIATALLAMYERDGYVRPEVVIDD